MQIGDRLRRESRSRRKARSTRCSHHRPGASRRGLGAADREHVTFFFQFAVYLRTASAAVLLYFTSIAVLRECRRDRFHFAACLPRRQLVRSWRSQYCLITVVSARFTSFDSWLIRMNSFFGYNSITLSSLLTHNLPSLPVRLV